MKDEQIDQVAELRRLQSQITQIEFIDADAETLEQYRAEMQARIDALEAALSQNGGNEMNQHELIDHAIQLLTSESADILDDARVGAPLGNSIVGSIMSLTLQVPRQYTEAAVAHAVVILDARRERG